VITFLNDLRHAARTLRRTPGFTAAAAATLALGIGVTTAMFAVVHGLLWKTPPVREPERLAVVFGREQAGDGFRDFSWTDYEELRRVEGVFEGLAAYYPAPLSLGDGSGNERLYGETVSGNYFGVLGVTPRPGRGFLPAEGQPGGAPVAVISHELWERRFRGDRAAVGRVLRLNGQAVTVVGVAPEGFHGVYYVGFRPDVWIAAGSYDLVMPGDASLSDPDGSTFRLMGRLRQGVSPGAAAAALAPAARRLQAERPDRDTPWVPVVFHESDARPEPSMAAPFAFAGMVFLAVVGLVLLLACANVAGLLLARGVTRRREMAVRLALGAGTGRLVRQALAESLLLGLLGGAAGMLLAAWSADALGRALSFPTDIPFVFDLGVDRRVLGFAAVISLLTALLCGLVPALRSARREVAADLKRDDPGGRGGSRSRLRRALVVGQVAVSCVLLVVAGLGLRTLAGVSAIHPGFEPRGGLLASVDPGLNGYGDERAAALYRDLVAGVRGLPGVRAAALARYVPLEFSASGGTVFVDGREAAPGRPAGTSSYWSTVSPGWLAAAGTPLLEGRDFTAADGPAGERVAIVSETFARTHWPGRPALGRTLRLDAADAEPVRVIGVAADVKVRSLIEPPQPFLYLPLDQHPVPGASLLVRTDGDPLALAPAVREVLRGLDPELPLYDVKTVEMLLAGRSFLLARLGAGFAGVFGGLALLLALVGLYGLVSWSVGRRLREIGIRVAVGAPGRRVLGMVVGEGMRLAGWGLALGVPLALAVTRLLRGLLYGVGPADPPTYAAIAAVLAAAALGASWIPARRALRVDPVQALRAE
jgi:predicted permease